MSEQQFTPITPVDQVVSRDAAPAALEQLRADRMNDKVGQDYYLRRSEYLHSLMSAPADAQAPAPPRGPETPEQQLERTYDEHMQAPAPEKYFNLPRAAAFAGEDAEAFDVGVRNVLHRGGIPQHLAVPILEGVIKNFDSLRDADQGTQVSRVASSMSQLRDLWGNDFDTRIGRVNDLLAEMMEADEIIGNLFDRSPYVFHASHAVIEYLDRVAGHRARRAAR